MKLVLHVVQCAILLLVVTVQGHGVGEGAAPGTDTALVVYAYHEGSANGTSLLNLRYFLKVGVLEDPRYMFAFVVNGCHSIDFPTHLPNVLVIERPNLCFDMGAWNEGVETVHHHLGYHADKKLFDRYVFINGSVRGPFLPVWAGNLGLDWVQIFTAQLNDNVKLVGTTFNCMSGNFHFAHLQSMAFATDRLGLMEVLLPILGHCPAIPKVLQGSSSVEESTRAARSARNWKKGHIVQYGEFLYSQDFLAAGYSIATLMLNYGGVTANGEINYQNWPQVLKACEQMATEVADTCKSDAETTIESSPSWRFNRSYSFHDPYEDDICRLPSAYRPHPLELIFFKTNKGLLTGAMQFYTQSALQRAGGLGDREYLLTKPMSAGVGCPSSALEQPPVLEPEWLYK